MDLERNLEEHIGWVIEAHRDHPKKLSKATRKWDGKTPYAMHPIWCATTLLHETALDGQTREEGALALLYHDILEDTFEPLPPLLSDRVKELVNHMTFEGGNAQEMQEVWTKPKEVRLYKVYDKVSNLLDGCWMSLEKRAAYDDYTRRLTEDAERNYGKLNITRIARAITG